MAVAKETPGDTSQAVLTSPLVMADSWLLSEAAWTAGRATGLMAMSCTEPEEVSKGSTADLATLSKRIPPSSSSLTATRAHQTHSAQRHRHFCGLLEGKFSKHTLRINDVLSALEVQAWETFTPGKNIPLEHRKCYGFKGLSVPSPKKVPIRANKMGKRRRTQEMV